AERRLGAGGCFPRAIEEPGQRHRGRLRPVPSRASPAVAGARGPCRLRREHAMTPAPKTHSDSAAFRPLDWTGIHPPALPASAVPEHVAVVMDGNGRWANARGLTRIEGHRAGEASLLDVVAGAIQIGVKHLS